MVSHLPSLGSLLDGNKVGVSIITDVKKKRNYHSQQGWQALLGAAGGGKWSADPSPPNYCDCRNPDITTTTKLYPFTPDT